MSMPGIISTLPDFADHTPENHVQIGAGRVVRRMVFVARGIRRKGI